MRGKRQVAIVMVTTMLGLVTVAFAAEELNTVTIQQLFLVTKTGMNYNVDQLTVKSKESTLLDVLDDAEKTTVNGTDTVKINKRITKELDPVIAQYEVDAAVIQQTENIISREATIQKAYDSWLLAREQTTVTDRSLGYAIEEQKIAKARYDAGLLSKTDLEDTNFAVQDAELALQQQKLEEEMTLLAMKQAAEIEADTSIEGAESAVLLLLDSHFSEDISSETLLPLAKAADANLYLLERAVISAETRLAYASEFYAEGSSVYDDYALALETAKRDFRDATWSKQAAVENALGDWQTALADLSLSESYTSLMRKELELAEKRKEAGVASRADLIVSERALMNAELSEWQSIAAFNQAEMNLRVLVGEEATVEEESTTEDDTLEQLPVEPVTEAE